MIKIIDVSNNQGVINWPLVRNSQINEINANPAPDIKTISGAILKASEGTWYTDSFIHQNVQGAREDGLALGFYHYGRSDQSTNPVSEANYFWNVVKNFIEVGDHIYLDQEVGSTEASPWALSFLVTLESLAGFMPGVYTGNWYIPNRLDYQALAAYLLWDSSWQNWMPPAPYPWKSIDLWQYTSTDHVDGINGIVDVSLFNGTVEEWKALGKPAPVVEYVTAPVYQVVVDHFLRITPTQDQPTGTFVTKGTKLYACHNPAPGSVDWTTNWRYVKTDKNIRGYAYAKNLEKAP